MKEGAGSVGAGEGGLGVGGELMAEGVERFEALLFAEEAEEFQFYGLPVDAAVEADYVCLDAFGGVGGVDGGAVAYVDHRRVDFAVGKMGTDGINAVGGDEAAGIGGENIGCGEADGASQLLAVDHRARQAIAVAEHEVGLGDVAVLEQTAYDR